MPEKHKRSFRFRFFFIGLGFHQTISRNTKNIYIIIYAKASTILENLTVNIFLLLYMPKKKLPVHRKVPVYLSPIRLRIILLIAPHEQYLENQMTSLCIKQIMNFCL